MVVSTISFGTLKWRFPTLKLEFTFRQSKVWVHVLMCVCNNKLFMIPASRNGSRICVRREIEWFNQKLCKLTGNVTFLILMCLPSIIVNSKLVLMFGRCIAERKCLLFVYWRIVFLLWGIICELHASAALTPNVRKF